MYALRAYSLHISNEMENNMQTQTLATQARDLVHLGANRQPQFRNLTTLQRERLTAAAMRDAGKHAYEFITNSGFLDGLAGQLIIALETKDLDDRKELLIKLGQILIEGAIEESHALIDQNLDNAITELAVTRQFYSETQNLVDDDNRERARDMNQIARGGY